MITHKKWTFVLISVLLCHSLHGLGPFSIYIKNDTGIQPKDIALLIITKNDEQKIIPFQEQYNKFMDVKVELGSTVKIIVQYGTKRLMTIINPIDIKLKGRREFIIKFDRNKPNHQKIYLEKH